MSVKTYIDDLNIMHNAIEKVSM